jgi:hypothetical protein
MIHIQTSTHQQRLLVVKSRFTSRAHLQQAEALLFMAQTLKRVLRDTDNPNQNMHASECGDTFNK